MRYDENALPTDEVLAASLSKLRLLVIQRGDEVVNEAAQNLAYIELLLEYPAGVALDVLECWPRKSKFWPAWHELQVDIETAIAGQDEPESPKFQRQIRLIVNEGCIAEFAGAVVSRYQSAMPRSTSQGEDRYLYSQALDVACGQLDSIGLPGEAQWQVSELPRHMPGYSNFVGALAQRTA